jgi:hypothetical protein
MNSFKTVLNLSEMEDKNEQQREVRRPSLYLASMKRNFLQYFLRSVPMFLQC